MGYNYTIDPSPSEIKMPAVRSALTKESLGHLYEKIDGTFGLHLTACEFSRVGDYSHENACTLGITYPDIDRYMVDSFKHPKPFNW